MDSLLGIRGKDFVILACSMQAARGITVQMTEYDKIAKIDDHKMLAVTGEGGDSQQFVDSIRSSLKLTSFRQGFPLKVNAAANYIRTRLATSLRTRSPFQVNTIFGGVDIPFSIESEDISSPTTSSSKLEEKKEEEKSKEEEEEEELKKGEEEKEEEEKDDQTAHLYLIDYLGTLCEVPFAAQGYCSHFLLSLFDRKCGEKAPIKADELSIDQAKGILQTAINQLQVRYLIKDPKYLIKVVTAEGIIEEMEMRPHIG
ncbi:putative multi-domain containing protein [Aduncisulcus paluster]|uniref:Proteasome subunit beta n=1 Tax=Aduncisulcus paluster TaxID=2918883 RepID=A0ABQ5K896_9EUKA|nr:putative multi-domain containing protein [Aduncisulcus paluster]